jgi:hypothetical protein
MSQSEPGYVLWEGVSQLDNKTPIVCILTTRSKNVKTGNMLQTWILLRDINPMEAIHDDMDAPICGLCIHRILRTCYVEVWQAPASVWKTYQKGGYTTPSTETLSAVCAGRMLRIGAYGDPAAVPIAVWDQVAPLCAGYIGYTHQWKDFPQLARYCMASVDSATERPYAKALGFRTFRARGHSTERAHHQEAQCPGAEEAGKKMKCIDCKYCDLTRPFTGDVTIFLHGQRGKKYLATWQ